MKWCLAYYYVPLGDNAQSIAFLPCNSDVLVEELLSNWLGCITLSSFSLVFFISEFFFIGHTRLDKIRNDHVKQRLQVVQIEDKMRKNIERFPPR